MGWGADKTMKDMKIQSWRIALEEWVVEHQESVPYVLNNPQISVEAMGNRLVTQLRAGVAYSEGQLSPPEPLETKEIVKGTPWNWLKAALQACPYLPSGIRQRIRVEYEQIPVIVKTIVRRICPHTRVQGYEQHISWITNHPFQ